MIKPNLVSVLGFTIAMSAVPFSLVNADNKPEAEMLIDQEQIALSNIYKVTFTSKKFFDKAKISFHAQMQEADDNSLTLILNLSNEEKNRLTDTAKQRGFQVDVKKATEWIENRRRELEKIKDKMQQPSVSQRSGLDGRARGIPSFQCYETVEETFDSAQQIADKFPNIAQWIDVADSWEKQQNPNKGHDIKVLKLTNTKTNGNKPKLFLNSGLHAREYATAPLALAFARHLTDNYGKNADITWILDHHEVHLMLHSNPDGRKWAEQGLSWRKNTNNNHCTDQNTRGVDLNRNFAYGWNSVDGGSSDNQCNITYHGTSAASEPETQAVQNYMKQLWQDNRGPRKTDKAPKDTTGIFIDIHSFGSLVLWPWGDSANPAPNNKGLETLGRRFAWFNNYKPQQASTGLYLTDGASDDFAYGELGVAGFTFELGKRFFEPCSEFESKIKPDNIKALLYAAKVARTPYITPSGPEILNLTLNSGNTDVVAGTPVRVTAKATDTNMSRVNGRLPTQDVTEAQYSIDTPFWTAGHTAVPLEVTRRQSNISGTIDTTGLTAGQHTVYVRAKDASGTWGPVSAQFLNIKPGDNGDGDTDDDTNNNGKYVYESRSIKAIQSKGWRLSDKINIPQNAPKTTAAKVQFTIKHPSHGRLHIAMINRSREYFWVMRADNSNTTDGQQTYTQTIPESFVKKLKGKDWFLAVYDNTTGSNETGLLMRWSVHLSK